jgi:hypothetical protein
MSRLPLYPIFDDLRAATGNRPARAYTTVHIESAGHFFEASLFNYGPLVVTFEDARPPYVRPNPLRQGWGVKPFLKRGVSVLAVKPKVRTWYSDPDLADAFRRMAPFFARFTEIMTYGVSMGGFGALAYADLIGAKRVVALAAQTTYRKVDGHVDLRFPGTLDYDHSHPFGDAAEVCRKAEAWLFYDRMDRWDRWQAERMQGANVERVNLPYVGHGVADILAYAGCFDAVVDLILTGKIDRIALAKACRKRRELHGYGKTLNFLTRDRPKLQARVCEIFQIKPWTPTPEDSFYHHQTMILPKPPRFP